MGVGIWGGFGSAEDQTEWAPQTNVNTLTTTNTRARRQVLSRSDSELSRSTVCWSTASVSLPSQDFRPQRSSDARAQHRRYTSRAIRSVVDVCVVLAEPVGRSSLYAQRIQGHITARGKPTQPHLHETTGLQLNEGVMEAFLSLYHGMTSLGLAVEAMVTVLRLRSVPFFLLIMVRSSFSCV